MPRKNINRVDTSDGILIAASDGTVLLNRTATQVRALGGNVATMDEALNTVVSPSIEAETAGETVRFKVISRTPLQVAIGVFRNIGPDNPVRDNWWVNE